MATYREIKGLKVPYLDADLPSASASTEEGGVWYNSSTGKLRAFLAADTWATTADINTGRKLLASAGPAPQSASLIFGGDTGSNSAATEEYDGSGWAAGGDLTTARQNLMGAGTQTAALAFGAYHHPAGLNESEEYNGSAWTEGNNLNTARGAAGRAGIQTAALAISGYTGSDVAIVESYDGSSWTEIADVNTARAALNGTGTQTAALGIGGVTASPAAMVGIVESWNGTSWTEVGDLNQVRKYLATFGTSSIAVAVGGEEPAVSGKTEIYDGSSWTETTDMSVVKMRLDGSGSLSSGVVAGGASSTAILSGTEEFAHQILTYTPAAWATGATLNVSRFGGNSLGTTSAALAVGGNTAINSAEEFDGTSWTAVNAMGTARFRAGSAGLQTSGLVVAGGAGPGGPITAAVEEYDGTNWTEQNDTPYARMQMGHAGTQTAAVCFGGGVPGPSGVTPEGSQTQTIEYDGTNWTVGGALPAARHAGGFGTAGTQTAALQAGGFPYLTTSLEYDGSSWSSGGTMIGAAEYFAISGTLTAMLAAGGATSAPNEASDLTQLYDGTSWYTDAATLNTGRKLLSGVGTTSSNLAVAGDPDGSTGVEEYTSTTSAAEAADITFD